MILVTGSEGTTEYRAARTIADAFASYWPGIGSSPAEEELVRIAANTKLSNYKVSDIDIVIAAKLRPGRYVVPKTPLKDQDDRKVVGTKVRVQSLLAALEVKGQDAGGLRISAGNVDARYREGWKSATEQNDAQKYALLSYFRDYTNREPWVYRCLLLQGINELPRERGRLVPAAATVPARFDAASLVAAMVAENRLRRKGREYTVSSGDDELLDRVLGSRLFEQVTPSNLDRQKMDRVAARPREARDLAALLGQERVHLRGEGGTGKTVLLAQAAHEAYSSHGKRSLLLTYNHALAADIQRLLAMMAIPSSSEAGGVDVRTVMSFTYSWFSRLGLIEAEEDLEFERYPEKCAEALGYIECGAISKSDIEAAMRSDAEQFDYDALIVDEAQDWPQDEADLLARLYGGEKISLADGASQLTRGAATDWKSSVAGRGREGFRPLRECLRMKANLGEFANAVASRAGLNWEILPSTKAAGGRVIISREPFHQTSGLHEELLRDAAELGNQPVDFLYCVPTSSVNIHGNMKVSALALALEQAGKRAWDGVDPVVRKDYPRSVEEHRVLQYESCRGLEGWVTVLDGFDEFWSAKFQEARVTVEGVGAGSSPEQRAAAQAWRWVMIALTRPIDTLVLTLRDPDSPASRTLLRIAEQFPDFVEIR